MRKKQPIDSQTLVRDAIDSAAFFYSRTQSLATVYDRDINSKKTRLMTSSFFEKNEDEVNYNTKKHATRAGRARVGRK